MNPTAALPAATPPTRFRWGAVLRPLLAAVVLVAVGTGVLVWRLDGQLQAQYGRTALLREEVKRVDQQLVEAASAHAEIDQLRAQLADADAWTRQRRWPAHLLRLLAESAPDGLHFELAHDAVDGVRLRGLARRYDDVAQLAARLARSPMIERIDVAALQRDGDHLRFTLDGTVSRAWRPLVLPGAGSTFVGPASGDPK